MTQIFVTFSTKSQLDKLNSLLDGKDRNTLPSFLFIDSLSKEGKKKSRELKSYWGASIDPFAIIIKDEKPVKAFYSEATDVINDLNLYLNGKID